MIFKLFFLMCLLNCEVGNGKPSHLPENTSFAHSVPPRFVSLRSYKVNLHVGPGIKYPIEWVLVCKNLPVLVITEFEQWRRIKLHDETVGWVHKSLLSSKPTVLIKKETLLLAKASKTSKIIAKLCPEVVAEVLKRKKKWIKIQVRSESHKKVFGWVQTENVWGKTG